MDKIKEITGFTTEQIKTMLFPERLAVQAKLTHANLHTEVLVVRAVLLGNQKVLDALLAIHALHKERGAMDYEMQHFRDWLSTLLVD